MSVERSISVLLSANVAGYIAKMREAGAATESAMGKASRASTVHGKALGALGAIAKGTGIAVAGGIGLAVKEAADFNEKMALVKTLSHATSAEMRQLSESAKTAGLAFGYTASEVADGQAEMIKAGVSLKDIMGGGLRGTLALAAAGQTDVATATTIAASAMTQFKLKGKDIPHLADLLAAGADKALGSVEDLGYGLEQVGTTAHQMGLSVEDTTGVLAAFAQAGLIGERGGTTFKQMLLQLAAPTKQAQELMDKYHLSLYDANGQIKTMPELAGNLAKAFKGIDPASRNAALGVIFGSRAIQGANIMLADGQKGIASWIRKVNDQGFAAQQASGKLNSLKGDLTKLKAAGENAFIALGQGSQNPLRKLVQNATTEIEKLTKNHTLEKWGRDAGKAIGSIVTEAGPLAKDVGHALKVVGGGVKTVADGFNSLPKGVQQAIVTGGIAAIGAHKLGVDSLLKGVIGSRKRGLGGGSGVLGLLSSAKPVPVIVVNKGFPGAPGEPGVPGGGGGPEVPPVAPDVVPGALSLGASTVAGAVTIHEIDKATQSHFDSQKGPQIDVSRAIKNIGTANVFGGVMKHLVIPGIGGPGGPAHAAAQDLQRVDDTLTHLAQGGNVKSAALQFAALTREAKKQHVSLDDLNNAFPHYRGFIKAYAQELDNVPPAVITKLAQEGFKPTYDQVSKLITQYHLTPRQVQTVLQALGVAPAMDAVRRYGGMLDHLNGKVARTFIENITVHHDVGTADTSASVGAPNRTPRAFGGRIPGWSPNTRADNIPVAATAGEHMWSVAEVAGAGGHAAMERMRYLARSGQLQGFADGGEIRARNAAPARYTRSVAAVTTTGHSPGPMEIRGSLSLDPSGRAFIEGIATDVADDRINAHQHYPTGRRGHR